MKKRVFCWIALMLGSALVAIAEEPAKAAPAAAAMAHIHLAPSDLAWMPAPPIVRPGAKMAVLMGDPGKEGFFAIRFSLPANYLISPHWHPTSESFTVLQGRLFLGDGDTVDKTRAKPVPTHGFASLPATHHHYAYTEEETVIDLYAYGPFQLYYVNPADDPSQAAAMKH